MKNTKLLLTGYCSTVTALAAFVTFTVLKLTGVIAWSWWWVTCPLWAPVAVAVLLVMFGYALLRRYGR